MYSTNSVADVREYFLALKQEEKFVIDKTGCKMLELVGASFIADDSAIFGTPNLDYIKREISWYNSCSLNVNDIPAPIPAIWKAVATEDGFINSNYGWAIWSKENHSQYVKCWRTLNQDPNSRRAIMIYTRPSMQMDYNKDGMSDFMCTNAVQYVIRDGLLHAIVQMRSNDIWAGYRNDYAWQKYVLDELSADLDTPAGNIYWQVGSLHCYERDFYLLDHFEKTGQINISKKQYEELYGVRL